MIIAAEGGPLELLKTEFPALTCVNFPGYNFSYPSKGSMALQMILSTPKILSGIKSEHKTLDRFIDHYRIEGVISDNRYGLWSKKVKSVFITHQISIKANGLFKLLEPILFMINKNFILKFDECWVPDHEGENNLSTDLAHYKTLSNMHYIGSLSRFKKKSSAHESSRRYDLMVILSGPEPQRSIFEKIVLDQLESSSLKALVVQGLPEGKIQSQPGIMMFPHLESDKMLEAMKSAGMILCRPGYSSIMDLEATGNKAILVPTPGQTEQEYLAKTMLEKGAFYSEKQSGFDLKRSMEMAKEYSGLESDDSNDLLKKKIEFFLKDI
ncbi:MAG: glycosyltransferase [Bacteroidetes bacterium]|nr:MAG: glycosyltransferase [Bacteroidota bacterium]